MSIAVLVVMAAVAVNGLLAGASLDQSVKQLPERYSAKTTRLRARRSSKHN